MSHQPLISTPLHQQCYRLSSEKSTWLLHAVELTSKVLLSKLWRLEHRFPKKIINKIKPLMDTIWLFSSALCRFERKPTIASQNYQKQKSSKALGWWMVPRTCLQTPYKNYKLYNLCMVFEEMCIYVCIYTTSTSQQSQFSRTTHRSVVQPPWVAPVV